MSGASVDVGHSPLTLDLERASGKIWGCLWPGSRLRAGKKKGLASLKGPGQLDRCHQRQVQQSLWDRIRIPQLHPLQLKPEKRREDLLTARACTSAIHRDGRRAQGPGLLHTAPLCPSHRHSEGTRRSHRHTAHQVPREDLDAHTSLSTASQWRPQRSANLTPKTASGRVCTGSKVRAPEQDSELVGWGARTTVFLGERESTLLALTAWWQCLRGGLSASWARA